MERLEDMFSGRSGFIYAFTNGTIGDEVVIPTILSQPAPP